MVHPLRSKRSSQASVFPRGASDVRSMLTVQSRGAQFNNVISTSDTRTRMNAYERHMVSRNTSDFTLRALKDKCHRKGLVVQISYRKYRAFACIWKCIVGYPTSNFGPALARCIADA